MQRTPVYLGEEEFALLYAASSCSGASRSELIRRAIRERYGDRDGSSRREALRESAGAWADRSMSGEEYVERFRGDLGERLERLGWS